MEAAASLNKYHLYSILAFQFEKVMKVAIQMKSSDIEASEAGANSQSAQPLLFHKRFTSSEKKEVSCG